MGRLIDADAITNSRELTKKIVSFELTPYIKVDDLLDFIDKLPTAYSVEKVVEKTEKQLSKLLHICALEDVDRVNNFYDSLEETIRKGGVE